MIRLALSQRTDSIKTCRLPRRRLSMNSLPLLPSPQPAASSTRRSAPLRRPVLCLICPHTSTFDLRHFLLQHQSQPGLGHLSTTPVKSSRVKLSRSRPGPSRASARLSLSLSSKMIKIPTRDLKRREARIMRTLCLDGSFFRNKPSSNQQES